MNVCGSLDDDVPANRRIPVVSACGEVLSPCGPLKALRLLESGKAEAFWGEGETFYLRLKFDPKSKVVVPEGVGAMVSLTDDMAVWRVIPPKRIYVEKLVEVAELKGCLENLKPNDKAYLEVLLGAKWDEIRYPAVLARVAPILKAILKGLAEPEKAQVEDYAQKADIIEGMSVEDEAVVWKLVDTDSSSLMKLFRRAREAFRDPQRPVPRRLKLKRDERTILMVLESMFRRNLLKRIVSPTLLKVLAPIVRKLLKVVGMGFHPPPALEPELKVGGELVKGVLALRLPSAFKLARKAAERIVRIAQSWGNLTAHMWLRDEGFIRYLAMA